VSITRHGTWDTGDRVLYQSEWASKTNGKGKVQMEQSEIQESAGSLLSDQSGRKSTVALFSASNSLSVRSQCIAAALSAA